jgi:hypothetical protein
MLFKDFNGAIKLIERFVHPELVEHLKNSTKEEDKVEYEISVMYNKLINKVMPAAMIKVYLEKGKSLLKCNTSSKEEMEKSCVYISDLLGFTFALNNAVNLAKAKYKVDAYGSITRKIENSMLIRLTRETWSFAERFGAAIYKVSKVLNHHNYTSNDLLIKIRLRTDNTDIFGGYDRESEGELIKAKEVFSKYDNVFDKVFHIFNRVAIVGLDQQIDSYWAWIDHSQVNDGIRTIGYENKGGISINIEDSHTIKGILYASFDISMSDTAMILYRLEKSTVVDGQYR